MRPALFAFTAAVSAFPGFALAQSINPVGMTLPNFQSASLMTVSSQDYTPLKAYDPSALATRPTPSPKVHVSGAAAANLHTAAK